MPKRTTSPPVNSKSVRAQYVEHGPRQYYEKFSAEYRNPHEPIIRQLLADCAAEWNFLPAQISVLDLACGSGEVTLAMRVLGCVQISGIDPFTGPAYFQRTQQKAESFSFEEVAAGVLQSRRFDLCICSFAMHLAPLSLLPQLSLQLSLISQQLLILTPHKRPDIRRNWGWQERSEIMRDRVRARFYDSLNFA